MAKNTFVLRFDKKELYLKYRELYIADLAETRNLRDIGYLCDCSYETVRTIIKELKKIFN